MIPATVPKIAETKLEETKCQWPNCKENSQIKLSLPMYERLESGNFVLASTEGVKVILPFCLYHGIISGNHQFGIAKEESGPNYIFIGPVQLISLIESVMGARETTKMQQPKNRFEVAKLKKGYKKMIAKQQEAMQ